MKASEAFLMMLTADGIAFIACACVWVVDHLVLADERMARIEWILAADYGEPTDPDPGDDEPIEEEPSNVVAFARRAA